VVTGPFAEFNGVIEDINLDQQKVVVLVNIFGRDTPVELGFDDIHQELTPGSARRWDVDDS
jgi:transcription termination/antitermination protein NusG